MKDLTPQSCCTVMPEVPGTPVDSNEKNRALRYVLYMIPLLVLWGFIYQELAYFSRLMTYTVLHLQEGNHLSSAIEFFIFETPKVLMLLTLVVFGVGIVRSFFSPGKNPGHPGGETGIHRQCAGRASGHRHPVLFLLRGAALYRVCDHGRSPGRDLFFSDFRAHGE